MLELLKKPLAFYAAPGGACSAHFDKDLADFKRWSWNIHRRNLGWTALLGVMYVILCLRDIEGYWPRALFMLQAANLIILLVLVLLESIPSFVPHVKLHPLTMARLVLSVLTVVSVLFTISVSHGEKSAGSSMELVSSLWLDAITILYTELPTLLLGNWSVGTWLAFACMQVYANTIFSMHTLGYSMGFAMRKIIAIEAFTLCCYFKLERYMMRMYFKEQTLRQLAASNASSVDQAWSKAGHTAASPVDSSSPWVSAHASPAAHLGKAHTEAPLPSALPSLSSCTQHNHAACSGVGVAGPSPPYVSRFRRTQVMIKIDTHVVGPESLSTESLQQLIDNLTRSLSGSCSQKIATRHGCVLISIEMCKPQQLNEAALSFNSLEDKQMHGTVLRWLQHSELRGRLPHGSVVSIQVDSSVLKYSWDAHTLAWSTHGMVPQPYPGQYAIRLPDVAIALPATLCSHSANQMPQQQPGGAMQVSFTAIITAPPKTEIVGWPDPAGACVKGCSAQEVQLLVVANGLYVPVEVSHVEELKGACGQFSVQARTTLPDVCSLPSLTCTCLKLELCRDNMLVSSCNALLAGPAEVQELRAAKQACPPGEVATYAEDLAEWLLWRSLLDMARQRSGYTNNLPSVLAASNVSNGDSNYLSSRPSVNSAAPNDTNLSIIARGVPGGSPSTKPAAVSSSVLSSTGGSAVTVSACSVAGAGPPSLLTLLVTDACRPSMVLPMTKVGLELLQQAVLWGMPVLATRLLQGLTAAPLSIPFHVVAVSHQLPSAGVKQQGSIKNGEGHTGGWEALCGAGTSTLVGAGAQEGPTNILPVSTKPGECKGLPQSLLLCAMLSRSTSMLEQCLAWGSEYGHPWDGSALDAECRCSPLEFLAAMDALWAQQAASVFAAWKATSALATACAGVPGQGLMQMGAASICTEAKGDGAVAQPLGDCALATTSKLASAGVGCRSNAAMCLRLPSTVSSLADGDADGGATANGRTALTCRKVLKAVVRGIDELSTGMSEEEYRGWSWSKGASSTWACCCGLVLLFYILAATFLYNGLLANGSVGLIYPIPSIMLLVSRTPKQREVSRLCVQVTHWALITLFGLSLFSVTAQEVALTQLIWVVDMALCCMMGQVRLRILLLERMAAFLSISLMYTHLGLPFPILQSFVLNVVSVVAGLGLDSRGRFTFGARYQP